MNKFDIDALETQVDATVAEAMGQQTDEVKPELPAASEEPAAEDSAGETPAPEEAPAPEETPPEESAEDRLKMLERQYKSMDNDRRHLKIRLQQSEEELTALRERAPAPVEHTPQELTQRELDQLEEDGLSPETYQMLLDRIQTPREPAIDATAVERITRIEQDVAARGQTDFETALTQVVPGWGSVNVEPAFHKWLAETRTTTGENYQEILNGFGTDRDVEGCALIFQKFQSTRKTPTSKPPARRNLHDEITPRTTGAAPTGDPGSPMSGQQVAQFYRDWALGKIPEAEAQKTDAKIKRMKI